MDDGKLDARESSKFDEPGERENDGAISYLSSSASLTTGRPEWIVCMRRTWLLLCLS